MGAGLSPTPIPVEQRFPLDLNESDHVIRQLYEQAKSSRWDPFREFDWAVLHREVDQPELRHAARLGYSRRAWQSYTGLTETPAILIRFCLEAGREADPKYFLTVRNTEEAWHIECFHGIAKALGGDLREPASGAFAEIFNQRRATTVLHADTLLDAYFVAHCAIEESIELHLSRASLANARQSVLHAVWARVTADRERHAAFGWAYLSRRAPAWTDSERQLIIGAVREWVQGPLCAGYQSPSLASPEVAGEFIEAEERLAEAGLGGVAASQEQAITREVLAESRNRLASVGLPIPHFDHPVLGKF